MRGFVGMRLEKSVSVCHTAVSGSWTFALANTAIIAIASMPGEKKTASWVFANAAG